MPGLMMSRSFGDGLAHENCGVIENPELKVTKIEDDFCCIVVASDGVYEKLTNEEVAEILSGFIESRDADKAAKEIVRVSKLAWINVRIKNWLRS